MEGRKRKKKKNPSGFPVRIRLKLFITADYLPGSSPFFFAAAVLQPPLFAAVYGMACSATDGHGIIFPAAKIGFSRLRSLTFPPSLLLPEQPNSPNSRTAEHLSPLPSASNPDSRPVPERWILPPLAARHGRRAAGLPGFPGFRASGLLQLLPLPFSSPSAPVRLPRPHPSEAVHNRRLSILNIV